MQATGEPDKPPVIASWFLVGPLRSGVWRASRKPFNPFCKVALGNFSEGDPFESETPEAVNSSFVTHETGERHEVPMDAMMEEQHLVLGSMAEDMKHEWR